MAHRIPALLPQRFHYLGHHIRQAPQLLHPVASPIPQHVLPGVQQFPTRLSGPGRQSQADSARRASHRLMAMGLGSITAI